MQPGIRLASKTAHTAINIDDITYGTTSGAVVIYYLIELSFSGTVITCVINIYSNIYSHI